MDYTKLNEVMEELRKASQKCGTTFQAINACAKVPLLNYGVTPNGYSPFFYVKRIDPPKTEEEMLALINRKDVAITFMMHYKRMRRGKLRRRKEEKIMRPNEYLKSIGWFYDKYKLLFDEEEEFLNYNKM